MGFVIYNVTCRWCKRAWNKQLSGNVVCPYCTRPRTRMGSDGIWVVIWAFWLGVGLGSAVTLGFTQQEPTPVMVEKP